jgi:hypothetical protein
MFLLWQKAMHASLVMAVPLEKVAPCRVRVETSLAIVSKECLSVPAQVKLTYNNPCIAIALEAGSE